MGVSIAREEDPAASRRLLEALTARLPQWFAQTDSNRHYAEQAEIMESWTARIDGMHTACCCSRGTAPSVRKSTGWQSIPIIIGRVLDEL